MRDREINYFLFHFLSAFPYHFQNETCYIKVLFDSYNQLKNQLKRIKTFCKNSLQPLVPKSSVLKFRPYLSLVDCSTGQHIILRTTASVMQLCDFNRQKESFSPKNFCTFVYHALEILQQKNDFLIKVLQVSAPFAESISPIFSLFAIVNPCGFSYIVITKISIQFSFSELCIFQTRI